MASTTIFLTLFLSAANAQLRPRRVGTNALGEQEAVLTDVPTGGGGASNDDGAAAAMAAGLEAMQAAMGGGGEGGLDMGSLLKNLDLKNNPMLKAMAEANPEMAKLMEDPGALQGQMEQMANMMSSPEGQNLAANMMQEMQNVMTDPEKLKAGLEQLSTNPALKGLADAVPGLREVLDDPEQLEQQAAQAAELFQNLADPDKAKELLSSLGGGEGGDAMEMMQKMLANGLEGGDGGGLEVMQEAMRSMLGNLGGDEGEGGGLGDLLGGLDDEGGGDDLKARVREQMAAMMNKRRAGTSAGIDEDEF